MFSSKSFVDRYVELVFMNHDKALAVKLAPNVGLEALKITYGMIVNWKA